MNGWSLFVDESGSLDRGGELCVVAGVLLPGPPDSRLHKGLRPALEAALPGVPWPPHRAELHYPASRLLAAAALPPAKRPQPLAELVTQLGHLMRGVRLRDHDAVVDLDVRLRRDHRAAWSRARAVQAQQDIAVSQILAAVAARGAVGLVACARVDPRVDAPTDGGRVDRDAYVRLLRLLIERLLVSLRHKERGVDVVHAVVADRTVQVDGQGLPLMPAYIAEIATEAANAPLVHPQGPPRNSAVVCPVAGRQRFFRDACPAGLVLADLFAYEARHAVDDASRGGRSWPWLAAALRGRSRFGLAMEICPAWRSDGAQPLPTLSWDGAPRTVVFDAFAQAQTRPVASLAPPAFLPDVTEPWVAAAASGFRT